MLHETNTYKTERSITSVVVIKILTLVSEFQKRKIILSYEGAVAGILVWIDNEGDTEAK